MHQPIIINGGFKGTSPGHWRFDHRVSILNACCPVCRKWPSQSLFRDFYHDFLAQVPIESLWILHLFLLRPLNIQQKSKPIDMLAHILHLPFVPFIMLCRNFSWRVSSFSFVSNYTKLKQCFSVLPLLLIFIDTNLTYRIPWNSIAREAGWFSRKKNHLPNLVRVFSSHVWWHQRVPIRIVSWISKNCIPIISNKSRIDVGHQSETLPKLNHKLA